MIEKGCNLLKLFTYSISQVVTKENCKLLMLPIGFPSKYLRMIYDFVRNNRSHYGRK